MQPRVTGETCSPVRPSVTCSMGLPFSSAWRPCRTLDRRSVRGKGPPSPRTDAPTPFGVGGPEPLKGDPSGYRSRRFTREQRVVHRVTEDEARIVQARYHYG
ncbi:type II toxin-antitoxin system YoeB family toxin [Nocardiopsis lambiniae]|uniref:Endoribonuclease YoeB n=1 Tax=Nocardiopsis lambiniae TaxID=3075539 RepID=A0ABU2MFE4_9ACTN|nr:type II toxin-antitoxin system YoeB family toxin [Nocardiopsis sp. DSM 44743]MDT0331318.1 type II toxin-antitoxin system YoeB family toxin [Nocardiopsis sp. DSM 44743]